MANLMYQNRGVQTNTRESVSQRQSGGKVLQDNRQSTNLNQLMTNAPVQRVSEEEEPLQGKFANQSTAQLEQQPAAKPNNTGLPDNLKSGIESLSGMSMDNVRVHYNSAKPAQLNALAYAQGRDIHVAPGQEKHLPHEAWHVVQQAQGRVKPTMQMKGGMVVNDDEGLEREADAMGERVLNMGEQVNQKKEIKNTYTSISQMRKDKRIEPSARKHYTDGWGAEYGIQQDSTLKSKVKDEVRGPGTISLDKHSTHVWNYRGTPYRNAKECSIIYKDQSEGWGPHKSTHTSIYHCGPSGPATQQYFDGREWKATPV